MNASQLLAVFELRRAGHPDFWIAHVLGFPASKLVPIGNASDYEIEMPTEDWMAPIRALADDGKDG